MRQFIDREVVRQRLQVLVESDAIRRRLVADAPAVAASVLVHLNGIPIRLAEPRASECRDGELQFADRRRLLLAQLRGGPFRDRIGRGLVDILVPKDFLNSPQVLSATGRELGVIDFQLATLLVNDCGIEQKTAFSCFMQIPLKDWERISTWGRTPAQGSVGDLNSRFADAASVVTDAGCAPCWSPM